MPPAHGGCQPLGEPLAPLPFLAAADKPEIAVPFRVERGEELDEIRMPLAGSEIGNVEKDYC